MVRPHRAWRTLFLLPILLLVPASGAAAQGPIAVVRIQTRALLDEFPTEPGAATGSGPEVVLDRVFGPLGLPGGVWFDPERPAFVAIAGLSVSAGWAAVVPVLDAEETLGRLGEVGPEDDDGVRIIQRAKRGSLFALVDRDYVTLAAQRDRLETVDRGRLLGLDLPRGSIALDLDLALIAPILQGALAAKRAAMQQHLEAAADRPPGAEIPDADSMLQMMDLQLETAMGFLANTARLQMSFERLDDQGVLHARIVPAVGSTLDELLREQPEGLPRLARALPAEPGLAVYVGHVRPTSALLDALEQFGQRYATVMQRLGTSAGLGDVLGKSMGLAGGQLACMRGDVAGWISVADEGFLSLQLAGLEQGEGCAEDVTAQLAQAEAIGAATGAPPTAATADAAARRIGVVEDVTVAAAGPGADELFTRTVDRLSTRKKAGGLSAERFAPLTAAAGFLIEVDLSKLEARSEPRDAPAGSPDSDTGSPAKPAGEDGHPGRVVFAARSERNYLALDLVMPLERLLGWVNKR